MKKSNYFILTFLISLSLLAGCTQATNSEIEIEPTVEVIETLEEVEEIVEEVQVIVEEVQEVEEVIVEEPEEVVDLASQNTLIQEALEVITLIANQDDLGLDAKASPTRGIRFSPYTYIDTTNDIIFYPQVDILGMFSTTTLHLWGSYDGTGDPINLTFSDYYDRFIYDQDFANPQMIGINTAIGMGNSLNNLSSAYPTDQFVEFHFSGIDPQYQGIDWRSLTLVFEDDNGTWYLVGIIHGEWTI